jgi:hypothetical protein
VAQLVPAAEVPAVTADAYTAAYETFATCMSRNGASLFSESTVGFVNYYSYVDGQAYANCYPAFADIDRAWQLENEYFNPTQTALRRCLEEAGVTPAMTVEGVWEQLQEERIDPDACTNGVTG